MYIVMKNFETKHGVRHSFARDSHDAPGLSTMHGAAIAVYFGQIKETPTAKIGSHTSGWETRSHVWATTELHELRRRRERRQNRRMVGAMTSKHVMTTGSSADP